MARLNQPRVALPASRAGDPRLGHLFGTDLQEGDVLAAVILGFPSDEGVRRKGRFDRHRHFLSRTRDLGDVVVSGDVETDQRLLGETLRSYFEQGSFAVVLGSGHEASYGHFLG